MSSFFVFSSPLSCKNAKDPKMVYHYHVSSVQRFKLNAFHFWGQNSKAMVYMYCNVVACQKDNSTSRCAKGCVHDSKNGHKKKTLSPSVTIGPVKINTTRVKQAAKGELLFLNSTDYISTLISI